jgi:putative molybdopterin biosynthesis protein
MLHIRLAYGFAAEPGAKRQLDNPLFEILSTVHRFGSVGEAARELDLSYRHVWGALKKWETELGQELLLWNRGKRARLSAFGEKLLYAEERARARAQPLVANLVAEMEREFALAFDPGVHLVSLYASHDIALARLKDFTAKEGGLHLDMRFCGSTDALAALSRGECMMAGLHVGEDRAPGSLTQRTFKRLLKPGLHKLIAFLGREQGLMVAAGNPKRVAGPADIRRAGMRFVNRQQGSGTRIEIDQMLEREGIATSAVNGYERMEATHLAVAAAVASGQADIGFGIRAAAAAYGLDFIPLMREQYYLACLKESLDHPAVQRLMALLRLEQWREAIADLPGYDSAGSGEVQSLKAAFPWYTFKGTKPGRKA